MALRATTPLLFAALAGVVVALHLSGAAEARGLLTLDDFGAVGDGIANDTQALVDAWKVACDTDDNTYLNVPAGKSYQIWPVTLAGPCRDEIKLLVHPPSLTTLFFTFPCHVTLTVQLVPASPCIRQISGNIVAPESPDEWRGGDLGNWLHFSGVSDLALSGGGIIDGRGQQWWEQAENFTSGQEAAAAAPNALHFEDCQDVTVNGITLQNSQREHLVFTRCSNVEANYLRVTSPEHSPGTVGVLLVSSTNVHIMDDLFSVGLGENGSLHKIEKIKTDTMFISNTKYGVRVKTYEQNTSSLNLFGNLVENASAVAVGEIDYIDITGTSATERAVTFACSDAMPCSRLSLTGVNLTRVGGGNASAYCHQAFGRNVGAVVPESCLGEGTSCGCRPRPPERCRETRKNMQTGEAVLRK
ncbi:hypothetical protein ACQ4PT_035648 [Festuca glaucescens]